MRPRTVAIAAGMGYLAGGLAGSKVRKITVCRKTQQGFRFSQLRGSTLAVVTVLYHEVLRIQRTGQRFQNPIQRRVIESRRR